MPSPRELAVDRPRRLLDRLTAERGFRELTIGVFAVLSVVLVVPFAIGRALAGEWLHAIIDVVVLAVALGVAVYTWTTRRAAVASVLLAALFLVTLVVVVHLFGSPLLVWAFPVTAASFFLLHPATAAGVNLLAIAAIAPRVGDVGPWATATGFLAALIATNALALVFAVAMTGSRQRFRTLAERDALTGAGNRRALDPALGAALRRAAESGTPSSLIAFDIDHFKAINDSRGHRAGDRALKALTQLIRESIRAGDEVYRYGGEEFVVIAHGAGAGPAGGLADSIRRRVAGTPVVEDTRVTVSAGVAQVQASDTPETWFRRADAMLYRAKSDGRDRVRVDRPAKGPTRSR